MISNITFKEALSLAQAKSMEADPNVFVFGLDVPDHKSIFGSTKGLLAKFGKERVFGTPLSEDAMTGIALGAAISGLRPVHVHIRVDFMLLGMNQIANMISSLRYMTGGKLKVPLVIRAVIGRGWGQSAQHSKTLHGIFAHIPGIKVLLPSSPQDAYSMLRAAINDDNPVISIEHRWLYDVSGPVNDEIIHDDFTPMIRLEGKDLTVVTTSWMSIEAIKAAEVLAKRGIKLEVIDIRGVAPFQVEKIVASVQKTKHCIVADYDWVFSGFSAEVASQIHDKCFGVLKKPVRRLGFAHVPCPTTRPLENKFYSSAVDIIKTTEELLGLSPTDISGEIFYSYEQKFKGPF
ncbi:MAG: alpha-ketoacid dehydrogenase subunit beta [Elusimicrobiota bacterium]